MITIKYYPNEIDKLENFLKDMFEITADNMYELLGMNISREEDYKLWLDATKKNIQNSNVKWILAFDDNILCGYTMYRINKDSVTLDEIEIDKKHQGDKETFYKLMLGIMHCDSLSNIDTLYAFSNKKNIKSQGILNNMGFIMVEEKPNSYKFEGNKETTINWLTKKTNV